MKAVITENLTKIYPGGIKAVDNVCISLEPGEVFGFLGPNGAGKTTTVKLLGGMLTPTGGTCRVFDIDPSAKPEQIHGFCGVVTEHAQMYDNMTGFSNLVFYGTVFGMSAAESQTRALSLLDRLDLMDAKDRKLGAYSTGMRQRLSLARAMIHGPKMLFLDEPTAGLDPESVQSVNNMIKSLAETEGTTIFLCTHQLRYAQEICSSYGLIDNGVLLAAGSIEHLRSLIFPGLTVSIEADGLDNDSLKTDAGFTRNSDLPMLVTKTGQRRYEINVKSEDDTPIIIRSIVESGGSVYNVSARRISLEEIYFALLEKRKEGSGQNQNNCEL